LFDSGVYVSETGHVYSDISA